MATRALIGFTVPDGDVWNYHHWDGYPEALGATLWELYHTYFERDLDHMKRFLVDEHPSGWSTINDRDFNAPPGFQENGFRTTGPECYCHGGRSEEPFHYALEDSMGAEWAYLFGNGVMTVLKHVFKPEWYLPLPKFRGEWHIAAVFPLDGPEPDWSGIRVYKDEEEEESV